MTENDSDKKHQNEVIIAALLEIKTQNTEVLRRLDQQNTQIERLEETATKRGAIAGAVAGTVSGSVVALGIEFIRAKLGM